MKMRIANIAYYKVNIPFKTSINHNLKKRQCSESLVLEIHTQNGLVGYGEGAPRKYVTGETLENSLEQMPKFLAHLQYLEFEDLEDIQGIIDRLPRAFPALIAATELALLDILGKQRNYSIGRIFSNNNEFTPQYSAVLPFLPLQKMNKWLDLIEAVGFQQLKLKVGHKNDEHFLALVRNRLGSQINIRLDANRAWSFEQAIHKIKTLEKYQIDSIEEPLAEEYVEQLTELSQIVNTPIMLDESVCTLEQAGYYAKHISASKLRFNLKISKMGGLMAASKVHAFATEKGIACQLGCNVGETAILSAAGRIFAQHHQLTALEGSYAPFFMEDDIGNESISFAIKGVAKPITGNGLGIKINSKKLKKYSQTVEPHLSLISQI
ncbi:MAG: enolase C-terminal domain-like protein [Bacteroidota bacterium]